jgi:hypothetical protein
MLALWAEVSVVLADQFRGWERARDSISAQRGVASLRASPIDRYRGPETVADPRP